MERILECSHIMLGRKNSRLNPFGDAKAGETIADIIMENIDG